MMSKRFVFFVTINYRIVITDHDERKPIYAKTRELAISEWSKWKRAMSDSSYAKELMDKYEWGHSTSTFLWVDNSIYEEVTTVVYDKVATPTYEMPS